MLRTIIAGLMTGEEGHAGTLPGTLAGVVGAVILGIGAANDTGWLAITGGIVLAIGVLGGSLLHHMVIDYDVFSRLDNLEGKGK